MRRPPSIRQLSAFARSCACALALAGCTPPSVEDPFVPIFETERLVIGASFDIDGMCLGIMDMWEAHIDVIEETLGVSRDRAWLFLYRGDETQQIGVDCNLDGPVSGCWSDPVVRSTFDSVTHELVHAWTATVHTRPLSILQEGIAERMNGLVPHIGTKPLTIDVLLEPQLSGAWYSRAAHFVAWLLDVYGVETFMALYTRSSRDMTRADVSTIFLDVLGATPEDLLAAYTTFAKEYYPAMGSAACGQGPIIPWQGDVATWPAAGSCAYGPFFGYETSDQWQRVTIEVSTPGTYVLDPDGRRAAMRLCLTVPSDEDDLPVLHSWLSGSWRQFLPLMFGPVHGSGQEDWADQLLELDAGIYEVWVERSRDIPYVHGDMTFGKL